MMGHAERDDFLKHALRRIVQFRPTQTRPVWLSVQYIGPGSVKLERVRCHWCTRSTLGLTVSVDPISAPRGLPHLPLAVPMGIQAEQNRIY
jgi:hypothetical protein